MVILTEGSLTAEQQPVTPPRLGVWADLIDVPVYEGVRRLALLPLQDNRHAVVDATGAIMYGVLLLGELRPAPEGGYLAVDAHGQQLDQTGDVAEMAVALFEANPERWGILNNGLT